MIGIEPEKRLAELPICLDSREPGLQSRAWTGLKYTGSGTSLVINFGPRYWSGSGKFRASYRAQIKPYLPGLEPEGLLCFWARALTGSDLIYNGLNFRPIQALHTTLWRIVNFVYNLVSWRGSNFSLRPASENASLRLEPIDLATSQVPNWILKSYRKRMIEEDY